MKVVLDGLQGIMSVEKAAREPRILLVCEDPEEMNHYTKTLAGLGGKVESCPSYREAVDRLGREAFDLVVVAQGTPAFEGCAVLKRARELNLTTPIVVISHVANMSCYIQAMELGAADYFESGTLPHQLLGLLDVYLNLSRAA